MSKIDKHVKGECKYFRYHQKTKKYTLIVYRYIFHKNATKI